MTAAVLWALSFGISLMAVVALVVTGASGLSIGLVLVACGWAIIAVVVDGPPPRDRRRPW